jgi:hypothetical protein
MWIKGGIIFILMLGVFSSCKKDAILYDREDALVTDTATFLYSANYISHTSTSLTVQVDMATFNGLNSEEDYNEHFFSDSTSSPDINYDVSNVSVVPVPVHNSYTTVLLFDQNNRLWYNEEFVGFYLRRFIEKNDSITLGKIGIASFSGQNNLKTSFRSEVPGSYFQNSWNYSVNEFYDITKNANETLYDTPVSYVTLRVDEAIDSMVLSGEVTGDKSITLFANEAFGGSSDLNLDATILKANNNAISINMIGPYFSPNIKRMAIETGGFVCEYENYNYQLPSNQSNEQYVSAIEVGLENLENLLRRDLVLHRCNLVITELTANFQTGDNLSYNLNYNGANFSIDLSIP